MARTPLRTYLKEIEFMIERGQVDEAAAHCRNILESYPKLVAAYRLMGKAFLEGKRYADAADLFQRVLSTVPDDFVSHVGMSIIKEDEGNLDAAIWHMERAFEVQPYNAAIQGELRRLYGRRDGVEPPKVRLTRGALARMYARGNLYQQAITELRAGLAEDGQRPDLQVLLARMFFLSGAKVEAVETCSQLLNKLPYCLEANRILSAILPDTGRKDDAQAYAQRVQALDPYLAQASPAAPSGDGVPEASVILDRLEYTRGATGAATPSQPAWAASLGVSVAPFTTKEEVLPDWLEDLEKETQAGVEPAVEEEQPAEAPEVAVLPEPTAPETPDWLAGMAEAGEETAAQEEAIPDWMKEAGWTSAPGAADRAPEEFPEPGMEEVGPVEGEIAAAEIPDWLKAMAPEEIEEATTPEEEAAAAEALMPWLKGSAPETPIEAPAESAEAPLEEITAETIPQVEEPQEAAPEEIPDWLKEVTRAETTIEPPAVEAEAAPVEETVEIPDWLKETTEEEEVSTFEAGGVEIPEVPGVEAVEEAIPGIEPEEAAPAEAVPEWMAQAEEVEQPAEAVSPETEIPDWLKEIEAAPEEGLEEEIVPLEEAAPEAAVLSDEDAAIAWLESLAAKQGAPEDELTTKPEERPAAPPEWISAEEAEAPTTEEAEPVVPAEEGVELPGWKAEAAPVEVEPVEEATPEEEAPVTPVEVPEWLPEEGVPGEEIEAPVEAEAVEAEPGELPDWLKALEAETAVEETLPVEEATTSLAEAEITAEQPPEPEAALPFEAGDETAALAWLESLAAKQGAPEEELITKPEERVETPPEWVTEAAEAEAAPAEEELVAEAPEAELIPPPEEKTAEMPEWIQEMAAEPLVTPEAEVVEEAPQEVEAPEIALAAETEPLEEVTLTGEAEAPAAEAVEEPLPDWLETLAEEEEAVTEQAAETEAIVPPEEEVELPEWMKEASEEEEIEELPWKPESVEMPVEPARLLDVNQASLVELEALPGVGFRMAQGILNHRQEYGPFTSLDDLMAVPNVTPELLQELSGKISVVQVTPRSPLEEEEELRTIDADQEILIRARNALMQEEIGTMTGYYSQLIRQERLLDEVIHDLHEALYRFPVEVSIWETLGDAYARDDQLQEALDAYTKAEELLR